MLGISSVAHIVADDFRKAPDAVSGVGSYVSMCWLKTLCNGWCTSTRMHEEQLLSSIFGCIDKHDSVAY